MTVKDKVQRAAAAAVLSRLIKYVRKDPDTNLVKLVDRSERFVGNIFPAKNFDSFREGAKDPENVWRQMDSEEYGGAPFLGAKQPVIKAHGSSKAKGIKNAIRQAKICVENDLCGTMQSALDELNTTKE